MGTCVSCEICAPGWRNCLVEQVLEHRALALEAVGVDVGEIVGDHVDVELLRVEPGLGDPQRADHLLLSERFLVSSLYSASSSARSVRSTFGAMWLAQRRS